MSTVVLVRHGRSTANAEGVLAGRSPGIGLDDTGRAEAAATAARLREVEFAAIVTSPMERCRQTAAAIAEALSNPPAVTTDDAITECDYGDWQGRKLSELADEDLWKVVQGHPSAARFPGGESLRTMQYRAVGAIRGHASAIHGTHGTDAVWLAVSHGDIIKSVLADALGLHLDEFQRINVAPASVSIVHYGSSHTSVVTMNSGGDDLSWLGAKKAPGKDADVGGGDSR